MLLGEWKGLYCRVGGCSFSFCVGVWCRRKVFKLETVQNSCSLGVSSSLGFSVLEAPVFRTMKGEEQGRRVPGARALPAIKSLRAGSGGCKQPLYFLLLIKRERKCNSEEARAEKSLPKLRFNDRFFSLQSFLLRDVGWSWELIDGLGGGCG